MQSPLKNMTKRKQIKQLFDKNLDLVDELFRIFGRKYYMNGSYEKRDYIQEGLRALYLCASRFDPKRKLCFRTYASKRIHGAFFDLARKSTVMNNWREKYYGQAIETIPEPCHDEPQIEISLSGLSTIEKTILIQHFWNQVTLTQIAKQEGKSKVWISHVKKRALNKLKKMTIEGKKYDKN